MSISRVIEVSFGGGSIAYAKVDTAYFYNNGIIFKPTDIELPTSYQVHWADSPQSSSTLETIGTAEGAPIPDDLWGRSRVIYGWIYLHPTNDSSITAYEVRIYKNVRAGLPDGTEPTPAEQSTIDQLIGALNGAVEQTGEDAESASQSARSASGDADRAEQARTGAETAQGKAEDAQESAERAKDDAETSERNASESERNAKGYAETASEKADAITGLTAQATTLPDGSSATASYDAQTGVMSFGIPKGKDGTDGDDGYSPTANVSKTGKVATITITDKNGTTSAQVEDGTDGIDGISPSVSVTDITGGHRVVITDKDGAKSFDVEDGATGATPNLTMGTVETLEPTESATATITGTPENPVLNLGIPQGEQGEVTLEDYYKAFPTDTASGSIASFTDGADDLPLKSLVVDINPVQDLHGQENPYPAGGGKNLLDYGDYSSSYRVTSVTDDGNGTFTVVASEYGAYIDHIINVTPNQEYCIKAESVTNVSGNASQMPVVLVYDGETDSASILLNNASIISKKTFTPTADKILVRNKVTGGSGAGTGIIVKPQLELGSTATTWSPYENICPISGWTQIDVNHSGADMTNPTTLTIQFGQTVYGGHLDVLSGELTVYPYYASYNGETLTGEWISDRDKYVAGTTPTIGAQVVNIGAQGVTVQLEPHEVASLYGVNNLWADSGDTEVVYRADTKLFIERLTAPDSADMIADANITSGQYFMVGNSLYKATANIANGSAIVVGTNCIRKSLSEALNEINA